MELSSSACIILTADRASAPPRVSDPILDERRVSIVARGGHYRNCAANISPQSSRNGCIIALVEADSHGRAGHDKNCPAFVASASAV